MGSPSRNVQYHPPRLSEDRLNLPQPHSPSLPTHCSGKSGMRPCDQALRRTQRHRHRVVPTGRAQGRAYAGVPAAVDRKRGCALHRPGPGEGAGAAHRAPPAPVHRGDLRLAGRLDDDGEPLLLLRGRRRLRAVLPEVLFLLPLQREAMHQRARVSEASVGQARHRVRAARQRHPALRRPRSDAAAGGRPDGRADRRALLAVVGRKRVRQPCCRPNSPAPRSSTGRLPDGSSSRK